MDSPTATSRGRAERRDLPGEHHLEADVVAQRRDDATVVGQAERGQRAAPARVEESEANACASVQLPPLPKASSRPPAAKESATPGARPAGPPPRADRPRSAAISAAFAAWTLHLRPGRRAGRPAASTGTGRAPPPPPVPRLASRRSRRLHPTDRDGLPGVHEHASPGPAETSATLTSSSPPRCRPWPDRPPSSRTP